MSIDIERALANGLDRTIKRNGLILVGLLFAVNVVESVVSASLLERFLQDLFDELLASADASSRDAIREAQQGMGDAFPLAFIDAPIAVLGVALLGLFVVSMVVNIGAIRTFVSNETEQLPMGNFTRRLVWTVLNLIVGGILYFLIVSIGVVLLVIPGIFFAVALFFYNYEIVVEEKNAFEALSGSWKLTSGNRLLLFVLGLLFVILNLVVSQAIGFVLPGATAAGSVVTTFVTTLVGVFGIAVAAQAYNQLRSEDGDEGVPEPTIDQGPGDEQGWGSQN